MSNDTDGVIVLTNAQSPYNAHFYAELEQRTQLQVYYAFPSSRAGRPWRLPIREWEHVRGSWLEEAKVVWHRPAADVLVSGDYTSTRALLRLLITRARSRSYFWGERLRPGGRAKQLARRVLFHGFDAVFAVGSWARASYRQILGPEVPIHVLPYVCADHGLVRQPSADAVVGFVGSLIPRKGVDILMRALALMDSPPRLELAGSGPAEQTLRRLAERLNIRASWLGELSTDAVNRARASWWLQAVPSRYDGWGVVVNEGLASGVPVLASGMTGAAHDLLDGRCGDIVWSEEAWPAMLTKWLPSAREEAVTRAAQRVG